MSDEPLLTPEFHLEDLASVLASLVAALAEAGVGGARLRDLLATKVQARCVACSSQVSGEEITEAQALETTAASARPGLRRSLASRRCPGDGCESRYCQLVLLPASDVPWKSVLQRAQQLKAARDSLAKGELENAVEDRRISRRQAVLGIALMVIGLGSLWAARRWWSTGLFPGTRRPAKYRVDPQSLPSTSGDR